MGLGGIEWTVELRFLIALGLGFLVGLERESVKIDRKLVFGGVRTHPIISLFGFGCGLLHKEGVAFALPVGLLAVSLLAGIAYVAKIRVERFGMTSEISALLTFVTGALAMLIDVWVAMALGILNTFLLSEKAMLESYVERLDKTDFLATVKFLLVTLIILPALPNKEFTQFGINPAKVWFIVVVVSTLGFVGYLLEKKFGPKLGLWMSGTLGGIVSSTAMTLSMGRLASQKPEYGKSALQGALLAGSVMYLRVLILIWIVNESIIGILWYRLLILSVVGIVLALRISGQKPVGSESSIRNLKNPFEIRPALGFALLFVILSVIINLIRKSAGNVGLIGLSALVGFLDVDPFILSLIQNPANFETIFVSAILIALMSNTIAKGIYFVLLSRGTCKDTIVSYAILSLMHLPFIFLAV